MECSKHRRKRTGDFLWQAEMVLICVARNQPVEVLKEVLKIISDMVYGIYLKLVLISELLTLAGLIITLNTNQLLTLHKLYY